MKFTHSISHIYLLDSLATRNCRTARQVKRRGLKKGAWQIAR